MIAQLGDEPGERLSQQALIERHRVTGGGDVVVGALDEVIEAKQLGCIAVDLPEDADK